MPKRLSEWGQRWSTARRGRALGHEVDAYLTGRYVQHWQTHSAEPLPAWAWLNFVAHGDPAEITREAAAAEQAPFAPRFGWWQCQAVVAAELVERAGGDPAELRRLQRDALCPLELDLVTERGVTPAVVARLALLALRIQSVGVDGD